MALRDRIAAELRDLDRKAGRAVSNVKESATSKVNRKRYAHRIKAEQQKALRQRAGSTLNSLRDTEPHHSTKENLKRDASRGASYIPFVGSKDVEPSGGNTTGTKVKRTVRRGAAEHVPFVGPKDVEPGTEAGDSMHQWRQMSRTGKAIQGTKRAAGAAAKAAAATQSAAQGRTSQYQGSQADRAWQAAHVSPPTDHQLAPVDDRGIGTFHDFVTGTRRAEGMDRFQQTVNRSNAMQWTGQHSDGSATVVTAQKSGGRWVIAASEQNPAGRSNGQMQIGTARSKDSARERALDWIEANPEGMPLHQQAGQRGAAGYATGESMVDDGLDFNTGPGLVDNDIVFGTGDVTDGVDGGSLVGDDDLDLVFGGDDWR